MPPKRVASVEVPEPDPEPPATSVPKKGAKNSKKLKSDVGESSEVTVAVTRPRKESTHPSTMEMIKEALTSLDSKKGPSAQAIRGYILEKYPSVDAIRMKYFLRKALAKGLENGTIVRPANSTGNGAQGRFRLAVRGKKPKGTENSDPNVKKTKGTGSKKTKPVTEKLPDEVSDSTAKKPKKAAKEGTKEGVKEGTKEGAKKGAKEGAKKGVKEGAKKDVAKTKVGTVAKRPKAKAVAKPPEGEAAAKKPGKSVKKAQ